MADYMDISNQKWFDKGFDRFLVQRRLTDSVLSPKLQ